MAKEKPRDSWWRDREFGRLTVIGDPDYSTADNNGPVVHCQCSCGNTKTTRLYPLKRGTVKSCGCLQKELLAARTQRMRPQIKDRKGRKQGNLTFLFAVEERSSAGQVMWRVRCNCGTEFVTRGATKAKSCRDCSREKLRGANSPVWKGGRLKTPSGYIQVTDWSHPRANKQGYVLEHIVVMEGKIGRRLLPRETVHHINGQRDDNAPDNLELWDSNHLSGQRVSEKLAFYEEQMILKCNPSELLDIAERLQQAAEKSVMQRNSCES